MNYRSIADLNADVKKWLPKLPNDLNIIVGIPRSGLLVANLLALYMDLPLTDVDGLIENRILDTGERYHGAPLNLLESQNVLVVDDSVCSGKQMSKTQEEIKKAELIHSVSYAAVYASPKGTKYVDFWFDIVDMPRVFEWNLMHHSKLTNSCVDIDGVLCRDPTPSENDDGANYYNFIKNVSPFIRPSKEIGWLVTCRLEKYRKETEEWLRKNNIKYNYLKMMDLPDKNSRVLQGNHALFKAQVYKESNAELFIESSFKQANEIASRTGKPVFCFETEEMIYPHLVSKSYNKSRGFFLEALNNPFNAFVKLFKNIKKRVVNAKHNIMAKYNSKT